jgi:hypothetical protein
MDEIWKPIPDYEGLYEVSDQGRVRSRTRTLRPGRVGGYAHLVLSKRGKRRGFLVHRLVLLAHVGRCPDGHESSHLNGDRCDNRLANLAWETASANNARKHDHGTMPRPRGELAGNAKLTWSDVRAIRSRFPAETKAELARAFGVDPTNIAHIVNRRRWWPDPATMEPAC